MIETQSHWVVLASSELSTLIRAATKLDRNFPSISAGIRNLL